MKNLRSLGLVTLLVTMVLTFTGAAIADYYGNFIALCLHQPCKLTPDNQYRFAKEGTCDKSPEGTLPFGQDKLTTPWPKINNDRGPVKLSLKEAGNVTLSWDTGSDITNCTKIEYEIKFNENFNVLDKDDPGRIKHGTLTGKSGQSSFPLATTNDEKGVYYIRIAAQKNNGADVALRSQPVIVYVDPPLIAEMLPYTPFLPFFNTNTRGWLVIDGVGFPTGSTYKKVRSIDTNFNGKISFRWETKLKDCGSVQLNIADAGTDELLHKETQTGKDVHFGCSTVDEVVSCIEREGEFDITAVIKKLPRGKTYRVWINTLNGSGQIYDLASKPQSLKKYYRSAYIKGAGIRGQNLGVATPTGLPFPERIEWSKVTPDYWVCDDAKVLQGKVIINFTEAMNINSVKSNLSIVPPWPGLKLVWEKDNSVLKIANMNYLWFDTLYTITLGTGAKTNSGKSILETPVQWRIKTLPFADACPEVTCMNWPKLITTPPTHSHPEDYQKTTCLTYETKKAAGKSISNYYLRGQFLNSDGPTLPGGTFTYGLRGTYPGVYQDAYSKWGPTPYWELSVYNALGWNTARIYYNQEEMPLVKADLWLKGVILHNGAYAVQVVNLGPDTIPKMSLPYLRVNARFIATTQGIVDSTVRLNQATTSGDFLPNTTRTLVLKTNDVPEGVVKKYHWGNLTYGLFNLYTNIYLVKDSNFDNHFHKQESPL